MSLQKTYEGSYKSSKERNEELEQELFNQFIQERRLAYQNNNFPLYLYSKRVYRAYHNAWRLVDRRLLKPDEIEVMKKLGIYKPSRSDLGIPRYRSTTIQTN